MASFQWLSASFMTQFIRGGWGICLGIILSPVVIEWLPFYYLFRDGLVWGMPFAGCVFVIIGVVLQKAAKNLTTPPAFRESAPRA